MTNTILLLFDLTGLLMPISRHFQTEKQLQLQTILMEKTLFVLYTMGTTNTTSAGISCVVDCDQRSAAGERLQREKRGDDLVKGIHPNLESFL